MKRGSKLLRLADRFLGIPLLALISLFINKRKLSINNIKSIALIRTAAIGDSILLTAIIEDIFRVYPSSSIILFTGATNYSVSNFLDNRIKVIKIESVNPWRLIRQLKAFGEFDVTIDFGQWPRIDAFITFLLNSRYRIGFKTKNQFRHYLFDSPIDHLDNVHEIINFRNLLLPLGIQGESLPSIKVPEIELEFINLYKNYIICHLWPGGVNSHFKEWPTNKWILLIDQLINENNVIVLTGTNEDKKKLKELDKYFSNNKFYVNICGKFKLAETVKIIDSCKLLISVNTGVMHIGAALNKNLIALHGPTSPLRWGPLNKNAIILAANDFRCGYLNLGFEYNKHTVDCMNFISVSDVFDAYKKFNFKI